MGPTQRFVPVGFFFGWLIENRAITAFDKPSTQPRFLAREISAPTAFELEGGTLDVARLDPLFAEFTTVYLHRRDAGFFVDMAEWFPVPTVFDVRDTWHNYEWLRIRLVERFAEWRSS